ncbi:UvrD-helicase domain-containing protein [Candidatus Babeliales bacterium]|nr:UvrD-helicase domain-containing protein [Candidatus Babeliales bacterium]
MNKNQKEAVESSQGALLVVAGAGSGKTRVITARIAHLIKHCKADPASIIAVTFTNKAAKEMRKRVTSLLDENVKLPFVGTFHSYCVRLLRSRADSFGTKNFSIIDSDDQAEIIRKLIKRYGLEKRWTPSKILHSISTLKTNLNWEEASKKVPAEIRELYQLYEQEKAEAHGLDFDDLLLTVYSTLRDKPEFAESLRKNIKHILVDEYQDTNELQHELLKTLALDKAGAMHLDSLCAVGDEDQSIYSWRGAIVENMAKFQKDFAPVKLIKIEQNYRSAQPILEAANSVISNNLNRTPKKLWSEKKASNRILALTSKNEYHEADVISSFAKSLPAGSKRSQFAILYRTHSQSRVLEEALLNNNLPYTIVGETRFYERKEIKDLLAYLRLIENPFDRISFFRALNRPTRGLGEKCEQALYETWKENSSFSAEKLLNFVINENNLGITGKRADQIKAFAAILQDLTEAKKGPAATLEKILELTLYRDYLRNSFEDEETRSRVANVNELVRCTQKFEERCIAGTVKIDGINVNEPTNPTLEHFLHEVALIQQETSHNNIDSDTIQMMTLHSAKGLEFNTVVLAGNEEGTLPSAQSLYDPRQLEEERRLFYVGITRARERLVLTTALTRSRFGQIETPKQSRFIDEIANKTANAIEITHIPLPLLTRSIKSWFTGNAFFAAQQAKLKPYTPLSRPATTYRPKTNRRTSISNNTSTKRPTNTKTGKTWGKNKMVHHIKFGHGLVTGVKKLQDGELCLTVSFKSGLKKILSKFLNML